MDAPVAAPAAAAPVSAPVSAPAAAPVSTPVSSDSGVSPASVESTTTPNGETSATPSSPALTPNDGESDAAFLARVVEAKSAAAEPEVKPAEPEAPAAPEASSEEPTPAEQTAPPEEADSFDDGYDPFLPAPSVAPKELNERINANAALKAALEADPDLKNTLFQNSRLAEETQGYKEFFQSPDEAKVAFEGNREYTELSDLVTSIQKPEDAQTFFSHLMELSFIQDENGQPVLDAQGNKMSDGTVGRLIHHTGAIFLNHFAELAKTSGNDELAAAVDVLRGTAFGNKETNTDHLSEEQRTAAADLERRENALKEEKRSTQAARIAEFDQSVVDGTDKAVNGQIEEFLGRTDVSDADKQVIRDKIRGALYDLIRNNVAFQREQDILMRRQMGPKTREERIGLAKKYAHTNLFTVAGKIVAEAGAKVIAKQKAQQASQAARVEASRSEAPGALRTSSPPAPLTPAQNLAKVEADLTARLGRAPKDSELMQETIRLKSGS